jgi:two-component system, OmpR family, response regulator
MTETSAPGQNRFRVLVVDDNRDAADSLCLLVEMWGHTARAAYDGAEALEAARAFQPDCLFADIRLPGIDGYSLARQVRGQPDLARAKLVALTAYSSEDHARCIREAGFDHHLVKPAEPRDVEGLLQMLSEVRELASRNVELARETRELIGEAKSDLNEVKQEIREVKEELREVRQELREVKDVIAKDRPDEPTG